MVTFSVVTSARALSLFITTELHIYLCSAFAEIFFMPFTM